MRALIPLPSFEGETAPASRPSLELDLPPDVDRLIATCREMVSVLAKVSRNDEGASVLGLGPCSAGQVTANLALKISPCVPTHQLFIEVLYEIARLDLITEEATGWAALERHCVALSELWNILSPTDLMSDHRLLTDTPPSGPRRLPAFWEQHLVQLLIEMAAQGLAVDC